VGVIIMYETWIQGRSLYLRRLGGVNSVSFILKPFCFITYAYSAHPNRSAELCRIIDQLFINQLHENKRLPYNPDYRVFISQDK
jgi:hypothetical protein